jgi:hypothetical protein
MFGMRLILDTRSRTPICLFETFFCVNVPLRKLVLRKLLGILTFKKYEHLREMTWNIGWSCSIAWTVSRFRTKSSYNSRYFTNMLMPMWTVNCTKHFLESTKHHILFFTYYLQFLFLLSSNSSATWVGSRLEFLNTFLNLKCLFKVIFV